MKKTIIFDLGGVLLDWNPRHLYRKIFSDQLEMDYFLREICTLEWNGLTDLEKSFADAVEELIPFHPEYADQIRAYHLRWEEMISGPFPGSVKILEELKAAGYPLAALSNWSSETFPIAARKYEFLGWFDPLVISGRVGFSKPDPEIFHILLAELNRDPRECLFIDDREENIQTAQQIGFETVHFSSPEQLRDSLQTLKIL